MSDGKTVKTWEKTKRQNLLRHKSGRYYARAYLNGKEIWESLGTDHYSIAEAKLPDVLKQIRKGKGAGGGEAKPTLGAKATFAEAATVHLKWQADFGELKRRSHKYVAEVHAAMLRSWPELAKLELRKVKAKDCQEWAARFARKMSATRYNAAIAFLRQVFAVAVKGGVIYANPAEGLPRRAPAKKVLELPSREQFAAFIAEMRAGHSRDSRNCADLAEGLAFTGCRIAEAGELEWVDVDFRKEEVRVWGDPEERTKNGEVRSVPMVPEARALFQRMRADREDERPEEKVFLVGECQGAMNRAAEKIGMARITHHDLRHLFATVAIESGVDIPTVSRWLGHKDGGALAMKTYGHLRDEHSKAAARKVSFAPVATGKDGEA